jgi:KaiC/GvpD/RAD55 family RecA-like ATPase
MVSGAPGSGKSRLTATLLKRILLEGREVVYITTETTPVEIEKSLLSGVGRDALSRISYLDGTAWAIDDYRLASQLAGRVTPMNSRRLEDIISRLQSHRADLIINSLSTFLFRKRARREVKSLCEKLARLKASRELLLFTVHEFLHPPHVYASLEVEADIVIKMDTAEVEKMQSEAEALYRISEGKNADSARVGKRCFEKLFKADKNIFRKVFYIRYAPKIILGQVSSCVFTSTLRFLPQIF